MGKQGLGIGAGTIGIIAAFAIVRLAFAGGASDPFAAGDTVTYVADLPVKSPTGLAGELLRDVTPTKVGYKHYCLQLFWIPFWTSTSEGQFVAYKPTPWTARLGERPLGTSPEEVSTKTGIPVSQLTIPWSARNPWGLYLLIAGLVIGGAALAASALIAAAGNHGSAKPTPVCHELAALFQDARYQHALEVVDEQYKNHPAATEPAQVSGVPPATCNSSFQAAFEAGVLLLVGTSIARKVAERNLGMLVRHLDQTGHGIDS